MKRIKKSKKFAYWCPRCEDYFNDNHSCFYTKKNKVNSKINIYKEKYELYLKLEKILKSKQLFQEYTLSDLHTKIISRFLKESSNKTAKDLRINKSLIYAVVEKCKTLYTIEDFKNDEKNEKNNRKK